MSNINKKLKLLKAFKGIILGYPYMSHLWVTRKCNLRCKFCYLPTYGSEDPSLAMIKPRLDKIRELGCRIVVIMGGEPTLRSDLSDIIYECKKRGLISYLVTNGVLLNQSSADEYINAGLDIISMSLDDLGASGIVNYPASFDPADKLQLLSEMKKRILAFIAIVITKVNIYDSMRAINMAVEYGLPVTITAMADCEYAGVYNPKNAGIKFETTEDMKKLRRIFNLLKEFKNVSNIIDPDAYFERIIDNKPMQCLAGKQFFDIDTDGFINLCVLGGRTGVHYSQLTRENFKNKLDPYRIKTQKECLDHCTLAAYFNTTYYRKHPIELLKMVSKG